MNYPHKPVGSRQLNTAVSTTIALSPLMVLFSDMYICPVESRQYTWSVIYMLLALDKLPGRSVIRELISIWREMNNLD